MSTDERDPLTRELRASLARHAEDAPRGEFLAERIVAAADQAAAGERSPGQPRRPLRTWSLPVIAAAGVAAAVVVGAVAISDLRPAAERSAPPAASGTAHPSAPPSTPAPATTSPPSATTAARPAPTSDLTGVRILDVTFYGEREGWALASANCEQGPGRCTAVLHSADGRTWTGLGGEAFRVPGVEGCADPCVQHVRFANERTGYAFGPGALFVSTDGGHSWRRQAGRTALALESFNDNVIRVAAESGRLRVSTAAIGSGQWTTTADLGPADGGVQLSRGRAAAYLLVTSAGASRLYRSTDDGASWTPLPATCSGGRGLAVTAGQQGQVAVLCTGGGTPYVAASADSGAHFTAGDPVPAGTTLLTGDPSTVLLAAGDGLVRSTNRGRGWTQIGGVTGTLGFVGFESTRVGRAVAADGSAIWTTRDGGATWQEVRLP